MNTLPCREAKSNWAFFLTVFGVAAQYGMGQDGGDFTGAFLRTEAVRVFQNVSFHVQAVDHLE
jgi:hypothetical protein